jgi:hypothetical protein
MLEGRAAGHGDARKIAFHIGQEHRHPGAAELFGDALERHRLAGAGRARDQAMAVGPAQQQHFAFALRGQAQKYLVHARPMVGVDSLFRMMSTGSRGVFAAKPGFARAFLPLCRAAMTRAPFLLLDDARPDARSGARLYQDPLEIVVARRPEEVEAALARIGATPGWWAGPRLRGRAGAGAAGPRARARSGRPGRWCGSRALAR